MRIHAAVFSAASLLFAACGGGEGDAPIDDFDAMPEPGTTGSIAGKVVAEHAGGTDVVVGAVISIEGGASAITDEYGDFVLDEVPAGEAIALEVRGPRADDPDHPFVFSTYRARVDVVAEETTAILPVLIPGCERTFDAAAGGTLDVASCGGSSRAQLVFPPDALVREDDGAAFTGLARVELAVADPAAEAQALALPPLGDPLSDSDLFGAIEVRLHDALTGDALQVAGGATVEVSVEVAGAIASATGDVEVRLFDPETHAWIAEPDGAVESRDGRTFYRFEASHFSTRGVAHYSGPIADLGCIDVSLAAGEQAPYVQLNSGGRWAFRPMPPGSSGGCVQAWPNATVRVRAMGFPGIGSGARILSAWETTTSGPPAGANSCDGSATTCGSADLDIGSEGCIDGTFQSTAWACTPGATVPGTLSFMRDGRVFHHRAVPNICSAFFGTVMVPPGNGPVYIRDHLGSTYTWSPSFSGATACENLGTQTAASAGIRPAFALSVRSNAVHAGGAYAVDLDASSSEGMIHTYQWDVFEVEDGAETLAWSHTSATPIASINVDEARYRVRLRVFAGASLVAETSQLKDVPGPTASFTIDPDPPIVDQVTTFDASASSGGVVSYEWDFDNDGTFDATGVTVTHTFVEEGAQQVRLRVTDGNDAIDESVASVIVQADLPPDTIRLTLIGDGYVIQQGGGFSCVGPGVCQQTFTAPVLLEAYVDGVPAHQAWPPGTNSDGYQAVFETGSGNSYDVTVTF